MRELNYLPTLFEIISLFQTINEHILTYMYFILGWGWGEVTLIQKYIGLGLPFNRSFREYPSHEEIPSMYM
jgi:hypothetical protein